MLLCSFDRVGTLPFYTLYEAQSHIVRTPLRQLAVAAEFRHPDGLFRRGFGSPTWSPLLD